jgi:pyruvate kinase
MNYEIISTLGPASGTEAIWSEMIAAGATAFRLNTSHLTLPELEKWLARLDAFFSSQNLSLPVVLDLQGSKWRLGQFPAVVLSQGDLLELKYARSSDQPGVIPVPHPEVFKAAASSDGYLVLNDARVLLKIDQVSSDCLKTTVVRGGPLSSAKGITYRCCDFRQEDLSEKDRAIFNLKTEYPKLRFAISYVKDAAEMAAYRALIGPDVYLIAKIERRAAVDQAAQMSPYCQEIWICRGDLGAELGIKDMAVAVNAVTAAVNRLSVPVIMAGQVLEHMTEHPTPTRSEICYLYDSLCAGYRGFVLSDEAAVGKYPVESCRAAALFRELQ